MSQTTEQSPPQGRAGAPAKKARGANRPSYSGQLPSPPRRRRPALTAMAVLLIVGGAAIAGLLALRMDSRHAVVVFKQDVPVGTKITPDMLSETDVASDGLRLVDAGSVDQVNGLFVRQTVYAGQLLDTQMLTKKSPISADQAQVGVPLANGKVPPGLRKGDAVRLLRIGDEQNPSEALCTGLVLSVKVGQSGGIGSTESSSVATVLVPQRSADAVVGAAGTDALGVALVKRGVSIDDAAISTISPSTTNGSD